MRLNTRSFRLAAFISVFALAIPSFAGSLAGLAHCFEGLLPSHNSRPGPYTDAPTPPRLGNQQRDPKHRGGLWSDANLEDASLNRADLFASLEPASCGSIHTLSVQASPGSGLSWEGTWPSADGTINTGNGDKLTQIAFFGWKQRGGLPVDLTLYHNSETNYLCELGHSWTWTFDIYINVSGSTATLHWGNGLAIPYTAGTGGSYTPPAGIHDELVQNTGGTWTLTTKDQIVYQFNTAGFCTSVENRNGNQISFTLNSGNYVTRVTDATGRYYSFVLNGSNQYTSVTDPLGRSWTFAYNGSNELTSITWPVLSGGYYTDQFGYDPSTYAITSHTDRRGNAWTATFNSDGSIASETDPLSHKYSYSYGSGATTCTTPLTTTRVDNYSSGRLVSSVDESGYSESFTRDSNNNLTTLTDKRGKNWTQTFDSGGNRLTLTDPNSHVKTWTYSSANDVMTYKNALSNTWTATRDSCGNLLTITDPLSKVTTQTFDTYGELASVETPLGNTTTLGYDLNGDLNSVTDPLTNQTTASYDAFGRPTSVVDPAGNTESVSYDGWSRPTLYTHPDSTTIQEAFDLVNHVVSVTDENSHTESWTFDTANRLTGWSNARGDSESYGYDACNRRTSITNGNGKTRSHAFTGRGELSSLTMADGEVESWSRDGNGNVTGYTNPLTQTTSYTFDNASRETAVSYPSGPGVTLGWDNDDKTTSMVDSSGTSSWTFDSADEVTALSTPEGAMSYTLDADGRRSAMAETGVGSTSYSWDADARLTSLTNPFSETTDYTYDVDSRPTQETFSSGVYTTYGYDSRSRPSSLVHYSPSGTVISSESYTFDGKSNLSGKTVDSVSTSYGYDAADQLTSESSTGYSASYTYDHNANRLSKTLNGSTDTYTYDSADKILTAGAKSYSYDGAGRCTDVTIGSNTTSLSYDYADRVTGITYPGGATNSFAYNGADARIGKTDSSGTYSFKRDGVTVSDDVLNDGAAEYTPGVSENRSGTSEFYQTDRLGSTTRITDSTGTVTDTRQYDAFGMIVSSTGTNPAPFGFVGRLGYQQDSDSALKLVGHRYYDPSIGRFLTRDRGKDGRNWYDYARNSPLSVVDDDGFRAISIQGAIHGPGWTYIPYTWWWGGVWRDPSGQLQNFPPPLGVAGGGVGVNGGVEEGEGGSGGGGLEFGITLSRDGIVEGVSGITETETSGAILGGLFALGDGSRALGEGVGPVGGWRKRIEAEKRALSTDGGSDYDNGEADGTIDPWAPKPN